MARRVVSVLGGPTGAPLASEPALEANAYALAEDVDLTVVLRGAGVEFALARGGVGPDDLGGAPLPPAAAGQDLRGLIESGIAVYAEEGSLRRLGVDPADLVDGVRVVDEAAVAGLLRAAEAVLRW